MAKQKTKAAAQEKTQPTEAEPTVVVNTEKAVKAMVAKARERGYISYTELNATLPQGEISSEKIEDIMTMLSEMGINVVESDEEQDESEEKEKPKGSDTFEVSKKTSDIERTDDPVRMYLREMGRVELLSREGEIAIAKRIEAGRAAMIDGLCESPLTFQAIVNWAADLLEEKLLLRDIVDLDATSGKTPPEAARNPNDPNANRFQVKGVYPVAVASQPAEPEEKKEGGEASEGEASKDGEASQGEAPEGEASTGEAPEGEASKDGAPDGASEERAADGVAAGVSKDGASESSSEASSDGASGEASAEGAEAKTEDEDDDEFDEGTLSLAAMEELLKPEIQAKFKKLTSTYKKFGRLQVQRLEAAVTGGALTTAKERRFHRLKQSLTDMVAAMHFNNGRIEEMVDQLYGMNRR
ncbi:MAG: RNA polymerase sigma factor region1.1 domain-containing protein, partial [Sphingomonadales bacterium]